MAGLCVAITFDGSAVAAPDVERMMSAAPHRSADGASTWTGPGAAIGFQRTIILPEDAQEAQPLVTGEVVVVADARLDNRADILPLLMHSGALVEDRRPTEAEIIAAAYRLWGDRCAAQLIGDFAFVIFDTRRRRVVAARDPMGMRALYYRWEPRRVLVASEIKQLLAAGGVARQPHEAAIAATLAGPYLPPGWTVYEGIEQVPQGHVLVVEQHRRALHRFWRPDPGALDTSYDEEAAAARFRSAFEVAVAARLRAARPAGIFLSGGMDSGSIASTAGQLSEGGGLDVPLPIRTYSWAFDAVTGADERGISDHILARYGTLLGSAVPADEGWPLAGYPAHAPDEDDPYTWVYQALIERTLSRCREDGVGLVLNGDRGDELTGDWVYDEVGMLRSGRVRATVADLRAAGDLPGVSPLVALRRQVLRPLIAPRWPAAARWLSPNAAGSALHPPWIPPDLARRVALDDIIRDQTVPERFDGAARTLRHQRIFLPQAARIAVLRERTRARYGMGFADPYSDRRLVELVLSLPQWLVQRRTRPKSLVRAAMRGVMPEPARRGAQKTIPYGLFDRGLRDRAVPVVRDLLTNSTAAAQGWLDERAARAVYDEYLDAGDTRWDFWWPITVEMWLRRWWEGPGA